MEPPPAGEWGRPSGPPSRCRALPSAVGRREAPQVAVARVFLPGLPALLRPGEVVRARRCRAEVGHGARDQGALPPRREREKGTCGLTMRPVPGGGRAAVPCGARLPGGDGVGPGRALIAFTLKALLNNAKPAIFLRPRNPAVTKVAYFKNRALAV